MVFYSTKTHTVISWIMTPCSLRGENAKNEGSMFLRHVGTDLRDHYSVP
jgi:hypothetical protein